jgi:hypothetical protein
MMNPTTPCGAMTRPVNSGDSCKTCCRYSERTSISPPFHRPSRNVSVVPSCRPLRCSRDRRMSGSGCLVSALAKAAVAAAAITTAAMTSGEVQPSTTPWDTANTMSVTALVISSAPRRSSRRTRRAAAAVLAVTVLAAVFAAVWPGPRMAGDRAAAIRPTGTLTRKTARQLVNCTRTPPRTWPATKPTEETAPYRPMARVRSGPSGKPVVMRDSAAGATMAAPAPCMTRAAISSTGSLASPPARLARENAIRPATNMRRRPSRSAARPPRIRRPPNEMAYPVTTHCTASAGMCSSRSIEGSATFTMLKSRTTMNAATRIKASCSGWRRRGGAAGGTGAGGTVAGRAGRLEDAVTGMIPIRYVTDRFGFLQTTAGR